MNNNVHVVLDTNTLVSALLLKSSVPRQAFDKALKTGKAGCIISGDQDLLVMNPFNGINIITPKEFLVHKTMVQ